MNFFYFFHKQKRKKAKERRIEKKIELKKKNEQSWMHVSVKSEIPWSEIDALC